MIRREFPIKQNVEIGLSIAPVLSQFETKCLVDCGTQVTINGDNNPNRTLAVWKMQADTQGTAALTFNISFGKSRVRVYDMPEGTAQSINGANVLYDSVDLLSTGTYNLTFNSDKPYLFVDFLEKSDCLATVNMGCYTSTSATTNPPPYYSECVDDELTIEESASLDVRVLDNDIRPDRFIFPTLRVVSVTSGSAVAKPTEAVITVTAPAWVGVPSTYTVHYAIKDNLGIEHCGTINVTTQNSPTVEEPPEAIDDFAEVNENESVVIGVLDNDINKNLFVLSSLRIKSNPAKGTVIVNTDGTITYFAPSVASTEDVTFEYEISDYTGVKYSALVTVTVNDVPPAAQLVNDDYTFEYLFPISVNPTQNDTLTGLNLASIRVGSITGAVTNPRFEGLQFKADSVITASSIFSILYEIDTIDGLTTYQAQMTFRKKGTGTQPTTVTPNIVLINGFTSETIPNNGALSFGNHEIGTSTYRSLTIKNIGTQNLSVTSVSVTAGFTAQNFVGSLSPNSQQSFVVVMDANTAGSKTGTLTVNSNDPDTPAYVVNLNGGVNQNLAPKLTVIDTSSNTVKAINSIQEFGNHTIGEIVIRQFTLKNEGNTVLNVSNVISNADFTNTNFTGSIPVGGFVNISVTMLTSTGGAKTGILSIISDDSNSPYTINLNGSVESPLAGVPNVQILEVLSPTNSILKNPYQTLFFGLQQVGTIPTCQIIIRNNGNAVLNLSSLGLPSGFTASGFTSGNIPAQTGVSVTLTMDTATVGVKEGLLLINTNDPETPVFHLNLSGEVVVFTPNIVVNDDASGVFIPNAGKIIFPIVELNASLAQALNVLNVGDASLNISSVVVAGDFIKDSSLDVAIVAPNTQRYLSVEVNTSSIGNKTGTVTINSNDPDTPAYVINLEGRVIELEPAISVQFIGDLTGFPLGATRQFGTHNVDDLVERTLRIRNNGNGALTISSLTFSGMGFTITPSAYAGVLAPQQGIDVIVALNTTTVGVKTSQLLINSNDPNVPVYELNFSGNVVAPVGPEIYVSNLNGTEVTNAIKDLSAKSLVSFPPSSENNRSQTLLLRNVGTADLRIKGVSVVKLNGPSDNAFGTNLNLQTIVPGAVISFIVSFAPLVAGGYAGHLNIVTNDADDITFRIRLQGQTDGGFGGSVAIHALP